jgi:hypothetical protein
MRELNNPRRVARVGLDTAAFADTIAYHAEHDSTINAIWPAITQMGAASFYVYEYHDEQKFIVGDGYGPKVHIFLSPQMAAFTHHRQFDTHGNAGVLAALVYVDAPRGATLAAPYTNLNLSPGLNCLHLAHDRRERDDRTGWSAYITPATRDTLCPHDYEIPSTALRVVTTTSPSAQFFDYPTAARISDDRDGQPLFGMRCAAAWCEIGPPRFVARSPQHLVDPGMLPSRENTIKGWHDEQRLADIVDGRPRPSNLRASLIPAPNLQQRDENDYYRRELLVATIWLDRDPEERSMYWRWGLRRGANQLYAMKVDDNNTWTSVIVQAGTRVRYPMKVIRRPHYDVAMPGTARWRFYANDEVMWYDCGGACCESFQ